MSCNEARTAVLHCFPYFTAKLCYSYIFYFPYFTAKLCYAYIPPALYVQRSNKNVSFLCDVLEGPANKFSAQISAAASLYPWLPAGRQQAGAAHQPGDPQHPALLGAARPPLPAHGLEQEVLSTARTTRYFPDGGSVARS